LIDFNKAIKDIADGLDNLFTSDAERLKYQEKLVLIKMKMYEMQMDLQRDLIKRNTEIAKKSWLGRWPEMLAVVGVVALAADLILRPILAHYGIHFIDIDESKIIGMLFKLLGLK
jgi:hypothetical protein